MTGGLYYWQLTKSPKYSLLQVQKAFEQHDLVSFEKYVDVEGITSRIIDQALDTSMGQESSEDGLGELGETMARGFVTLIKPQLSQLAKQQIAILVETGNFEAERESSNTDISALTQTELFDFIDLENLEFQGIEYINVEGAIAYIGLKIHQKQYDTDMMFELKMRNKGKFWQIAELSNYADYLNELEGLETKRINELNAPILEAMVKSLVVENIRKSTQTDDWGIDKKVIFSLQVNNIGERDIERYVVRLTCNLADGKELKNLKITDEEHIAPGKTGGGTWSTDVSMFDSNDNLLFDTPETEIDITADIQLIEFSDGTILKLVRQ